MSPLFGPSAEKVRERGTAVPGTIIGIEVRLTHDEEPVRLTSYAVEAGGTVYGVRQELSPISNVRLGMPVTLRVDGKAAVIDWGDVSARRWKTLSEPPAVGIDDPRLGENRTGLEKARTGTRVTATVLEFVPRSVAFGLGQVIDARCSVQAEGGAPHEASSPKVDAPFYAAHLATVGATLVAWETAKGALVIDWPASAEAYPGVGRPAERPLPGRGAPGQLAGGAAGTVAPGEEPAEAAAPAIPAFAQKLLGRAGVPEAGAAAGQGASDAEDVVSWETFLDVQHQIDWGPLKKQAIEDYAVSRGVPAGEWPAAQRRWQLRMGSDPTMMVEYGLRMSRP
jgi:hypothetical protein